MSKIKYTPEHEWLRTEENGVVTVGITDFAQEHLGDLVYVQLPEVGAEMTKGEEAAVIESVKTAGEILMPADGVVVEINTTLSAEPGKVNGDPMGDGWIFKMKITEPAALDDLMDEDAYSAFIATLD
jgi:glycine cleavage system H protein